MLRQFAESRAKIEKNEEEEDFFGACADVMSESDKLRFAGASSADAEHKGDSDDDTLYQKQ